MKKWHCGRNEFESRYPIRRREAVIVVIDRKSLYVRRVADDYRLCGEQGAALALIETFDSDDLPLLGVGGEHPLHHLALVVVLAVLFRATSLTRL
jgi:hypothetical protein